jgi:hypothetical protein
MSIFGDRLACEGIAHNVPIRIGHEDFTITCVNFNLGAFDFVIGFDFL